MLDQGLRELDIRAFSHKVATCIKRINEFIGKLDAIHERISQDGMDAHEQLINSDSSVIETALDCRGDLESFHQSLQDMFTPSPFSPETLTDEGIGQMQSKKISNDQELIQSDPTSTNSDTTT